MKADLIILPAIFYIGAILILIRFKLLNKFVVIACPVISLILVLLYKNDLNMQIHALEYTYIITHLDHLSFPFVIIFCLISAIGAVYSFHISDRLQYATSLIYAGSALGVVLAGDFLTLYIFWELMAIASTFLVLASRNEKATKAAFRYFAIHIFGGLLLLAGIVMELLGSGPSELRPLELTGLSRWLIFWGIALNGAIPPLHAWLKDAYPLSTVTGAVFLSAFTTKSAVYVMARLFPGAEILIYLGAFMTFFPIFYAVLENDIRSVLSYSLINQVGFMMCGVGIGTPLAINGAVSHAFCHIIYKTLLFMSTGAVLHVTGRIRCTQLGGLYKTMPLTALFCMIGAASISAFPLFSGFVSKSMIVAAAAENNLTLVWLTLQFASAGVFHHAGIKVPYFTFLGEDRGIRAKEPPINMLLAMGIAAFLCVFIGIFPGPLYSILPYPVRYIPYTGLHVITQLQLLMFGMLAFYLLMRSGVYPPEIRAINLDADWFYRRLLARFIMPKALKTIDALSFTMHKLIAINLTKSMIELPYRFHMGIAHFLILLSRPFLGAKSDKKIEQIFAKLESETSSISIALVVSGIFILWILL